MSRQSRTGASQPTPLPPTPSPSQLAWQEMERIAFAHFGVNTFTDAEWGDGTEDPGVFSPTAPDARQWVRVLKDAGFRMLILTAKHHDGFCLWPSSFTEHCVRNSPWRGGKGDVVREVADACRDGGIHLGLYLSPWDRHEPTYGNSPAYNAYFKNQLTELLTRYGRITEVWFDGACAEGPNGRKQEYDWPGFCDVVRKLQPGAVIFGGPDIRWVGNEDGMARETEWSVQPAPGDSADNEATWHPAECDVSIRPGWFYHAAQDAQVKSLDLLLDIYYKSVGRNSVLLLNVPPDRRGLLHENDAQRLGELRAAIAAAFNVDLAAAKRAVASRVRGRSAAFRAENVLDGRPDTFWTTDDGVTTGWIEIDLGAPVAANVLRLEEPVLLGQRVQSYHVDVWTGTAWSTMLKGTTIGYRKLDRFPTMTFSRIRLVIDKSRACPLIRAFGLHRDPRGA